MNILSNFSKWMLSGQDKYDMVAIKKANFLLATLQTTFMLSFIYMLFSKYIMRYPTGADVCIYFLIVHVILISLFKFKVSPIIIGNAYSFLTLSGFLVVAFTTGGVSSPIIAWLLCTIVSAYWYANKLSGIIWSIFTISAVTILFLFEFFGIQLKNEIPEDLYYVFSGTMYLGILGYYLIVIVTYEKWQKEAKIKLKKQNDELTVTYEELTQQTDEIMAQREMLHEHTQKLEKVNSQLNSSINYASKIQRSLMEPEKNIQNAFNDAFIIWEPRDIVGGDFYWYSEIDENRKAIAVIDCTGHGVPAAFMTIMANDLLHQAVNISRIYEPKAILQYLDQEIRMQTSKGQTSVEDGMDMSIIVVDTDTKTLTFAGAKQTMYAYLGEKFKVIKGGKSAIGGHVLHEKNFEQTTMPYAIGDVVYVQTDGFQDQFGGKDFKKYLKKRYRELLQQQYQIEMSLQKEILLDEFSFWRGKYQQTDDILIVGIKL
ncbi:PP2C family protein-serine/threonine phosphatase [Flammeovirga sp. SJP92]|uniref:PP2C family protein-serine/threonine phosphatase n=1 Tax=Flammeovirga sp. SJP92 TaxID=1775430 RepID=UPI00079363AE|nr:SpoIIE family protein phosphatase [Flammeovirga sp. SJP92]KXX69059.1 hypothetical protein AVL50_18055 [Flammeovirga sp. SJP92]